MKKILIILILITYFGSLFILRLSPNIEISKKRTECLPILNYEVNDGIKILTMKGCTVYEAGFFHGEKLKTEILEMKDFLKNDMLLGGKDKYLGSPIYSILQNKAKNFVQYIPQTNLEEMKGIADGAGVSFNDILLINTYDDILQIAGCSSMGIPKKIDFNDYFIHTRNLDYPIKILAKNKVVLKYDTHISIGFPGYIGVLTGIGEKGISLSNHTAYSINKGEYGIPSGLLYRKILINANNILESKNILEKAKRTIANNLMIGSYKENKLIVAELDSKKIDFREKDDEKIIVSTNHYRTEGMKKNTLNNEGSRYKQYFDKVEKIDKINMTFIKETIRFYKESNYWETIANNGTVQSVIMIPETRKIYVANGKNIPVTEGKYIEISY